MNTSTLQKHFAQQENILKASYVASQNFFHKGNKGSARELFVQAFLKDHLSEAVAIGSGEIIDSDSAESTYRNQIDVILYRKNYPKVQISNSVNLYFVESVMATIEVKSSLTKCDLKQAMNSAMVLKSLTPHWVGGISSGYQAPGILNYLFAYSSSTSLNTIANWISDIEKELKINDNALPPSLDERIHIQSQSIDGIFILDKGLILYDNFPFCARNPQHRTDHPNLKWNIMETESDILLLFFLILTQAFSGHTTEFLDAAQYAKGIKLRTLTYR